MYKIILITITLIWAVIVHELTHYYVALYLGYKPKLILYKSKKEKSLLIRAMNLFLPFPAVKIKDIKSLKHLKLIILSPIITTFIILFLAMLVLLASPNWYSIETYIIWSINLAVIVNYITSYADIKTVKKWNKIFKNIKNWFIYIDKELGDAI